MKSILAIVMFLSFNIYATEVKYNVAATSDYVWRGQTQTNNKSAIQGGFDVYPLQSFQLGLWSSNVEGGTEIDFIGRYTHTITDSLSIGAGGTLYYYTKNNSANTPELNLILTYRSVFISANYTPDYFGTDTSSMYYEAGSTFMIVEKEKLSFIPVIGFVTFDDKNKSGSKNHLNYRLELAKETDHFTFKVFFTDTNRKTIENDVESDVDDQSFGVMLSKVF